MAAGQVDTVETKQKNFDRISPDFDTGKFFGRHCDRMKHILLQWRCIKTYGNHRRGRRTECGGTDAGGKPYPIHVENITIIPGETTVQELLQAGYDLSDYEHGEFISDLGGHYYSEVIDPTAEADSHSYYPLILVKDGFAYAQVTICNANDWTKKPLPECVVSKLEVMSFHENSDQAAVLDIPFAEVTKEAVSESLGAEPEKSDSGRCVWKKGKYSLTFEAGDGESGRKIISEYELN